MSAKSSKKQLRQEAAAAEMARRAREAEQRCPLSRAQLNVLLDYLAERIAEGGHDGTFKYTLEWLSRHSLPIDPTLDFFRVRRLNDDWAVAVDGDPHKLFGPTEHQFARMSIPLDALNEMLAYVDGRVVEFGCDHTLRFTREWLTRHEWPVHPTEFALRALGGGCDCEVVLNVDPSTIYRHPQVS